MGNWRVCVAVQRMSIWMRRRAWGRRRGREGKLDGLELGCFCFGGRSEADVGRRTGSLFLGELSVWMGMGMRIEIGIGDIQS
jgi:hypothetical protein